MPDLRDQLSRPLRDLRISVTDRCNFRCPYCMPKEVFGPDYPFLPKEALLTDSEIVRLARVFSAAGVRKLRITGGEPLMRAKLTELISTVRGETDISDISMTTNAWFLEKFAQPLADAGLNRVNVSLDSLSDEIFGRMNGRGLSVARVLRGIDAAVAAGLPVKINMVVQKAVNDGEILPMARYFRERGIVLRFIEYMDVGNSNGWKSEQVFPAREIITRLEGEFPLEPLEPNYQGEVASRYRYAGTDREIGIISSVTKPFCQDCNRARLSADGKLFTCLFAVLGTDFRAGLRQGESDQELLERLTSVWGKRTDRYSEERSDTKAKRQKIEMSYIGG